MDTRIWRPPPQQRRRPQRINVFLLLLLSVALLSLVQARSPHPPPLRRIAHPSSTKLEILPRGISDRRRSQTHTPPHPSTLRHDDSVLITLNLPDLLPFPASLLLKPSELFHPNARISYGSGAAAGVGVRQGEALRAEDWRIYTGEVIHPRWIDWIKSAEIAKLRTGWEDDVAVVGSASIIVHHPGTVAGKNDKINGIGTNTIFEGSFSIFGTTYTVMTRDKYLRVKTPLDVDVEEYGDMVVFRDADKYHDAPSYNETASLQEDTHSLCSHDILSFNSDPSHPVLAPPSDAASLFPMLSALIPWRRDDTGGMTLSSNSINSINSTAGCPTTQEIVYMGVALDCNYITTYGSTDAARTQVLNNWNQVSALYKNTFNISLGIIELQVQNATCPTTAVVGEEWNVDCNTNLTLDQRLSDFSSWRGSKGDDGAGLWHLMSACPTDSEVGVAWLGTLCQTTASRQSGSTVSGTGISTATTTEWSLIAHEIGHGFGAIHDCSSGCSLTGSCCPLTSSSCNAGGRFIMNPTTSSVEQTFSGCTLGNICSNIGSNRVTTSCIQSPGSRTVISLQQCGNGIVEDGEDCDPGTNATSSCCDASTCKFTSGSVCDPINSACCTSSCQLASSGTVCRPAVNSLCDYEETCTGTNATCPEDETVADGTSCGSDGLACASGTCTSLNLQCQTAGGSLGLTTACGQKDDTSCVVTCRDPNSANTCVVLQTELVDGSPCGYGGHCYNSTCKAGSWQNTAASWYRQNLQISIPVTVVAGLLILGILLAILRCIFRGCTGQRRNNKNSRRISASTQAQMQAQQQQQQQQYRPNNGGFAPNGMMYQGSGPGPGQTRDMSQLPPPPPPPMRHNADSISSSDPMMYTGVVSREPSPNPNIYYSGQGSRPISGGGGGSGIGGQRGYSQYQQENGGWVDPSNYNGQYYGRQEAYGR